MAPDKKARAAALQPPNVPEKPNAPPPKGGGIGVSEPQAKAMETLTDPKGKGKGKEKGQEGAREPNACYNFSGRVGCKYV